LGDLQLKPVFPNLESKMWIFHQATAKHAATSELGETLYEVIVILMPWVGFLAVLRWG
jgi:hypothetical protein